MERQELLLNDIVVGNTLVATYAKCGALAKTQGELARSRGSLYENLLYRVRSRPILKIPYL